MDIYCERRVAGEGRPQHMNVYYERHECIYHEEMLSKGPFSNTYLHY
jgi:hypothetical protein